MVDITDPVQTIVGLLKSSTTGIGTAGYEITNDAGAGLTVSNGDILVSYALSREELKDLFGGSQDYDVIITVRKGEVEDDWIGLSTKQWKVPVIIEVYIIDKWSGAGTNLQTITATLVREKVENAIRKFIKDKTNAPGGSVHRWLGKTYRDEEDRSLKPIIYKCTITTESWTYYDPPIEHAVVFSSSNGTINLGIITLGGTSIGELPKTLNLPEGTYELSFVEPDGYNFTSWSVTGSVSVVDEWGASTVLTVSGAGTITANYETEGGCGC